MTEYVYEVEVVGSDSVGHYRACGMVVRDGFAYFFGKEGGDVVAVINMAHVVSIYRLPNVD